MIAYIKDYNNDTQRKNLDLLFKYSTVNSSVSFSQKKVTDGDRFVMKINKVNSISKAIELLANINQRN